MNGDDGWMLRKAGERGFLDCAMLILATRGQDRASFQDLLVQGRGLQNPRDSGLHPLLHTLPLQKHSGNLSGVGKWLAFRWQ
jgi:hypothetical protein